MQADNTSIRLYSLTYKETRTYLFAALFVIGNIVLPQICHLIPDGGHIFLPIYFFTLVGAYKYGWRVGLLTALASPVVNSLLFGMPPAAALPAIMLKSTLLALFASMTARRYGGISLLSVFAVVAAYQLCGMAGEWIMSGSLWAALSDIRLGLPGLLLQIFGGYAVIRMIRR